VITGFAALVDPAAGGRRLEALVGVTLSGAADSDDFARNAARLEPVTEVLHLAGAPDYQLRVACRDTAELDRLLRHLKRDGGVTETETRVVLRSAFARGAP
jgi:Lrp/AsnC family leucine-responsive transcriptional regulator